MSRPLVIDSFPFNDEFDMLEMRLEELFDAVDWFVLVEADVTHQDNRKPFHFKEHADRFAPWADKIRSVQATGLPTVDDDPDPWARELAQREYAAAAFAEIGIGSNDIILHGDVDEIPRAMHARNVRPAPGQLISFDQRMHCFAVDWQHPDPWRGTVAARSSTAKAFGTMVLSKMRDTRNVNPLWLPDSGWHFSWLGGRTRALEKLNAFCHPEIADRCLLGLENDTYYTEGYHVDGRRQTPVEVDESWPRMIRERRCPETWWRPR